MAQQPVLVILAGGASSRMWPLREKLLLRFGSEPLMVSQLQRLRKFGFQQMIVIASPDNRDEIAAMTAPLSQEMNLHIVVQEKAIGMGDAILKIAPVLGEGANVPLFILQLHDVVDDALYQDMLTAFQNKPDATFIAGYEREDYFPGGYLVVDPAGRITGMVEKPGAENRPSNLVNIVAHIHASAAQLFSAIRAEYASGVTSDDHYERAMDKLMKQMHYQVVPYRGFWGAIKYPWHVLEIMEYYLSQISGQIVAPNAFIAPTASLVGNVYIGAGAKVFPGAAVVGPAYIGTGTIVGNNALVRNSMVLNNVEVGFTTEVARSYVADGCSLHACRVLDSVFAEGVNFSAGCTTANLRIDKGDIPSKIKGNKIYSGRNKLGAIIGRDAFLGVDVLTMPGVKVGERAQVGPGTHVHQDVQNGQRVYVKQQIQVVQDAD